MPSTPDDPLDVINRYLDVMRSGDRETGYGFFADDVTIRIPGRSAFAGTHRGRDAVVNYIESAMALPHEGGVELELIDMLASRPGRDDLDGGIGRDHLESGEGSDTCAGDPPGGC